MKQQRRSGDTQARILHAAEICFARQGYDATGVSEICAAAGVSKGAFYHHFAAKQDVFMALLTRWLAGVEARLLALRDETTNVPDSLRSMSAVIQHVLDAAGDQFPIYLEFWNKALRDPDIRQAALAPYRHYQQVFAGLIEKGITEGTLKPVQPQTAARVIVALAVGLLMQGLFDQDGDDWQQVAYDSMNLLLHGLMKE